MKRRLRVGRLWIAVFSSLFVGAMFLVAWELSRERWPAGTIFVPRDTTSLADAVSRATPGTTIVLDAGRGPYPGGTSIRVPDVEIRSTGGRAVIAGGEGAGIVVEADGVTIDGVVIRDVTVGIALHGSNGCIAGVSIEARDVGIEVASGRSNAIRGSAVFGGRIGVEVLAAETRLSDLVLRNQSEAGIRARDVAACQIDRATLTACAAGVFLGGCTDARLTSVRGDGGAVGVEITGGSSVRLASCEFTDVEEGVRLEKTEGASIEACRFRAVARMGAACTETERTRIATSVFLDCAAGIHASGGGENAFLANDFHRIQGTAIAVQSERDDLISANRVDHSEVGILLDRVAEVQVLRNRASRASLVGILADRADGGQMLTNEFEQCAVGIALAGSSGVTLQRNTSSDAAAAGLVFWNGTLGNAASENRVLRATRGILLAGSSRDAVTGNSVVDCDTGLALCRIGFGDRLESNDVTGCRVGLTWDDALSDDFPLFRLGYRLERSESATSPLLADNAFRTSRDADATNATSLPLLAGGNRWSQGAPRVEGRVVVPSSGWKGTLALGSGTSTVDLLLGRLLEWMLVERGVRVVDLIGLGSDESLARALEQGDANALWRTLPGSMPMEAPFWSIPARAGWVLVARPGLDLRSGTAASIAVPAAVATDAALEALERAGLRARAVEPAVSSAEAEGFLKFGSVDCAVLDRLEETVTLAGFVTLEDAGTLPSSEIGLVVEEESGAVGTMLRTAFEELRSHLTTETLKSLVSRVRLLGREPLDVAMDYLLREGLVGGIAEGSTG